METTFKRLKDNWNDIIDNGINYETLELFDWEKWAGTFIADQGREVLVYMKSLLESNTFPREDKREFLTFQVLSCC